MRNGWLASMGLKVVALFLAFVVWFIVSAPRRERVSERAFAAPLALVGMPREMVITTQVPDTVSVRLRGRVSDLRSLSSQNLEVTVDLSWAQPGEAVITLRPQAINVPPSVEVVSMEPTRMRFRVEQLRQKVVQIRPLLVGQPPPGFVAGTPTLQPDQALISGPLSQMRSVNDVATERIIMTGRTAAFTQSVGVVSESPLVRVIEPLSVQVTVPLLAAFGPEPLLPSPGTGTESESQTSTAAEQQTTTAADSSRKKRKGE
ncbi:MAG: YbbR family protein [Acidobacteria bacterium]|nr:YbbR family protein [Acidobacteriota bacterium]